MAAVALCTIMTTAYAAPANLGSAYISNVTSGSNCVQSNTNGGGIQFWDIQAGGTYTVTLSGVTDCASQGNENTIGVIVRNSTGGNIGQAPNILTATLVDANVPGVYSFTVTLTNQCFTMPIEYCTVNGQPGTGKFARDYVNGGAGGHIGHLRTATFGDGCTYEGDDTSCQGGGCDPASITVCKYFHFDPNAVLGVNETGLSGWPFCLSPLNVTQTTGTGGCTTFSNLTPGEYVVNEATPSDSNWFHSTDTSEIVVLQCGQNATVKFGNYCTQPSGGFTLGYWSNRNGQAVLQANDPAWRTLLNGLSLRNANGTNYDVPAGSFSTAYSSFRTWLLSANATNMAYMLSAQLAALKLDVAYKGVAGGAFDLCSSMTLNELMSTADTSLFSNGSTPAGNTIRPLQEMYKSCIDAINNNGPVVPVTPCDRTNTTYSDACSP
jgi:hypothetical protein